MISSLLVLFSTLSSGNLPNVLFLFSDDHAFDAVRANGNGEIWTPNLDRLAARGTTFTHAYNMGAWGGAVCVASRTMLATGRTLFHARAENGELKQRYQEPGRSWPQLMAAAGYRVGMSGKWHVKMDAARCFGDVRHLRGGMPNQTPAGYDRPHLGQPDPWDPADPEPGGFWKGGKHWSEVVADDVCDMLRESREAEEPFFLYCAFNAPHDPRQSPREFLDRYPPEELSLPRPFLPEYPHKDAMRCSPSLRDEKLAPFPRTHHAVRVHRAEYYAIITHLDAQIGRILDTLEATGQAEDTWIVYTSDHGLSCGHHGLLGKQNMYDPSMRVPFIVAGPGVEAGRRLDHPIYLQDVMPTALQLAGAEVPSHVEFQSLLPALEDPATAARRDRVFGSYMDCQRMLQSGELKLIVYPRAPAWRLYDTHADPHEERDLAGDADRLPDARRLFALLREEQARLGDDLSLAELFPELVAPR